jgi:integrase
MRAAHLTEYFEKAHEKTGVRRSKQPNYPWRHTDASIGLTSNAEPAFLAKQLGHTLAVFYSTYASWIETETDRKTVERVFADPKLAQNWPADDSTGLQPA